MKLQLRDSQMISNQMDTDTPRTTTIIDNDFAINQLEELHETISILASGTETLNGDIQRLNSEIIGYENRLQHLIETISNVKSSVEEEHGCYEAITRNLELLNQDLLSLQEKIDDIQCISYDRIFVWKITKVREKLGM